MSTPKNKSIQYFKAAIVISIILGVIGTLLAWLVVSQAKQEILIPTVSSSAGASGAGKLRKGSIISRNDITMTSVGKYNLNSHIITDPEVLIGKYVNRDYCAEEMFWDFNILADYPRTLSERVRYTTCTVPVSLLTSSNADIQEDDFVSISIILPKADNEQDLNSIDITGKLGATSINLVLAKELEAVRVLGFYDGSGIDITHTKENNNMSADFETHETLKPSFIVLDVNPIQKALITKAKYEGTLEIDVLPREIQLEHQRAWGLVDENNQRVEEPVFTDDSEEMEQKKEELEKALQDGVDAENKIIDEASSQLDSSTIIEDPSIPPTETPSENMEVSQGEIIDLE